MSVGELILQLEQAKRHMGRASELILRAEQEMGHAEALIRRSLEGASDQALVSLVSRSRQHLIGAGRGSNETTQRIDETIARFRGSGGLGK